MKNGYEEALKFERQLNAKLRKEPMTKDNAREYWRFFRTINSGLQILEKEAIRIGRENRQDITKEAID
jgi:hypothetical protein